MIKKIILTLIAMGIFSGCQSKNKVDITTIKELDLNRYMGLWYEVARYENRFERGMKNPTAHYSINDNGTVRVENSADLNGSRKTAVGKAKLDPAGGKGALKVAFFWNFYAPYRILMLDPEYKYALVASGSKYLWILSRTPQLDQDTLKIILKEAQKRGFDTQKLIYTQTK